MLEALTLIVLGVVLLVKYFTVKHMQSLTEDKIALEQVVSDNEYRYKKMQDKRKENEKNFEHLKRDRYGLETFLQRQRDSLVVQQEKNLELERLII